MNIKIGIIGGTGIYNPEILDHTEEQLIKTEYGEVKLKTGFYQGQGVAFLARHGEKHAVPPHLVNYRGNIMALKKLGVERIIATAAVGSLNRDLEPGQLVLINQFIDFTKTRSSTFFEGGGKGVVHVDFTEPYCPSLRKTLKEAAGEIGLKVNSGGTYVCTEGPRFETPAEIIMYSKLGGDLVGMTSVPEVVLAREAEICYATIAMVTNYAAGISTASLTIAEVMEAMANNTENIRKLTMKAIEIMPLERDCLCKEALKELGKL